LIGERAEHAQRNYKGIVIGKEGDGQIGVKRVGGEVVKAFSRIIKEP